MHSSIDSISTVGGHGSSAPAASLAASAFGFQPNLAREQDWCEALRQMSRPRSVPPARDAFRGDVSTVVSPQGIEFSLLAGSPQTLTCARLDPPPSLWLALLIEGRFLLDNHPADPDASIELMQGDLLCGPTGQACTLSLPHDFRFLYVRIPHQLLQPRLLDLRALPVARLSGARGVNRVFAAMLRSIADTFDELDAGQLRPIETALTEFVFAGLWQGAAVRNLGTARAGQFQRICEAMEARLGDCELSLQGFAADQHASPRYIQKLFSDNGFSFSGYLRLRRLERCRADLACKSHEALSISEICFRWGFNDAAHFSRSFRAQFGTTPRGYRHAASTTASATSAADKAATRPSNGVAARRVVPGGT